MSVDVISRALEQLRRDYDTALVMAGNDEQMVTLYLPGEWAILARRTCELIVTEVMARARQRVSAEIMGSPAECTTCGLSLWRVHVDPATQRRITACARCGTACHV